MDGKRGLITIIFFMTLIFFAEGQSTDIECKQRVIDHMEKSLEQELGDGQLYAIQMRTVEWNESSTLKDTSEIQTIINGMHFNYSSNGMNTSYRNDSLQIAIDHLDQVVLVGHSAQPISYHGKKLTGTSLDIIRTASVKTCQTKKGVTTIHLVPSTVCQQSVGVLAGIYKFRKNQLLSMESIANVNGDTKHVMMEYLQEEFVSSTREPIVHSLEAWQKKYTTYQFIDGSNLTAK